MVPLLPYRQSHEEQRSVVLAEPESQLLVHSSKLVSGPASISAKCASKNGNVGLVLRFQTGPTTFEPSSIRELPAPPARKDPDIRAMRWFLTPRR